MMSPAETRPPKVSRRTLVALAAILVIVVRIVIVAIAREANSRRLVAAPALSRPAAPALCVILCRREGGKRGGRESHRLVIGVRAVCCAPLGGSAMTRTLFRTVVAFAAVAGLGVLFSAGTLRADDKDKDFGKGKPGQ